MKSLGSALVRRAPRLRRPLLTLAGLAGVVYGAWMIYHPAGVILAGVAVLVFEGLQDDA